ncbi:MAG: hypothetical protein CO114_07865 [Euryarchaeota archaeon CG_4_9_14_3_um_filter_38_12]|nr:MAG: hypothetical protein CO114_07865 [Euryarchaeota archaeon CG_4_9_14_3_um_filter_38_12]
MIPVWISFEFVLGTFMMSIVPTFLLFAYISYYLGKENGLGIKNSALNGLFASSGFIVLYLVITTAADAANLEMFHIILDAVAFGIVVVGVSLIIVGSAIFLNKQITSMIGIKSQIKRDFISFFFFGMIYALCALLSFATLSPLTVAFNPEIPMYIKIDIIAVSLIFIFLTTLIIVIVTMFTAFIKGSLTKQDRTFPFIRKICGTILIIIGFWQIYFYYLMVSVWVCG